LTKVKISQAKTEVVCDQELSKPITADKAAYSFSPTSHCSAEKIPIYI